LAAWCELRDAFRHFRIDRVEALSVLEEDIPRSRDSLLTAYRRIEPQARV
ncbi:MAG: WYL domain-containing protein, partial [Rhodobacteraceae bacterium]|nr:WYL domain-containing protein [Paracoccaceae bacterium]